MFRSPSRNQRSKGFKVKHGLQIFLLLAVSVWLLYQIKHSHDKRKAFDESHARLTENLENVHEVIKLGRKDLPKIDGTAMVNEKHGEEEENDEEENRHEEEEEEDESKPEESEEEERGGGDDEIDEQDQDREDFIDEEDKESEEKENQKEDSDSSDEQDHDRNTQEAREEIYKGDDASSAVARDTQTTNTEASGAELVNPDEDKPVDTVEKNALEVENGTNNSNETTSNLNAAEGNNSVNAETRGENLETKQSELGNESQATLSDNQSEVKNDTSTETAQGPDLPILNGTDINSSQTQDKKSEALDSSEGNSNQQRLVQEQPENNSIATEVQQSGLSTTTDNADSTGGAASSLTASEEQPATSNATAGEDSKATVNESGDQDPSEKPETNAGIEESDDNAGTGENEDEEVLTVTADSSESTTPLYEEQESRTDLSTLPEI